MRYEKTIPLKDGRLCRLVTADSEDAAAMNDLRRLTAGESDNLLCYPDELKATTEEEAVFLHNLAVSENAAEICAMLDGTLAGTAGFSPVAPYDKCRHRAEFGICVAREYWGLGIGRALTAACVELAKQVGYAQVELDVVAGNRTAIALYESMGFREYGRNPLGFKLRSGQWQELVYMRLEL